MDARIRLDEGTELARLQRIGRLLMTPSAGAPYRRRPSSHKPHLKRPLHLALAKPSKVATFACAGAVTLGRSNLRKLGRELVGGQILEAINMRLDGSTRLGSGACNLVLQSVSVQSNCSPCPPNPPGASCLSVSSLRAWRECGLHGYVQVDGRCRCWEGDNGRRGEYARRRLSCQPASPTTTPWRARRRSRGADESWRSGLPRWPRTWCG